MTNIHENKVPIDLRKTARIQFEPQAADQSSRVIDYLDYGREIVNHLEKKKILWGIPETECPSVPLVK